MDPLFRSPMGCFRSPRAACCGRCRRCRTPRPRNRRRRRTTSWRRAGRSKRSSGRRRCGKAAPDVGGGWLGLVRVEVGWLVGWNCNVSQYVCFTCCWMLLVGWWVVGLVGLVIEPTTKRRQAIKCNIAGTTKQKSQGCHIQCWLLGRSCLHTKEREAWMVQLLLVHMQFRDGQCQKSLTLLMGKLTGNPYHWWWKTRVSGRFSNQPTQWNNALVDPCISCMANRGPTGWKEGATNLR